MSKVGFAFGTVSGGGFVLLELVDGLIPDPSTWTQAAWFIDPVNGNDGNDGKTPATAVKTWNGGVIGKMGTTSPILTQNTTFTFLSSQTDPTDVVTFKPFCQRCWYVITGTRVQVAAGALSSVTAKNRAAGQVLEAALPAGAARGMLVVNTTRSNSVAMVHKAVSGPVFELTQPQAPTPAPCSAYLGVPAEDNTWANTDNVIVYSLTGIYGGVFEHVSGQYLPPSFFASTLHWLHLQSPDGPSDSNFSLGPNMSMSECWSEQELLDTSNGGGLTTMVSQCMLADVQASGASFERWLVSGAIDASFGSSACFALYANDCLLNASFGFGVIQLVAAGAYPGVTLGNVAIRGSVTAKDYITASAILWDATAGAGSASFNLLGGVRCAYPGTAVSTFLCTILANGTTTANPFDPATGTWEGAITLSAANLDAAFGVAGFGGNAIRPGGASYIRAAQ